MAPFDGSGEGLLATRSRRRTGCQEPKAITQPAAELGDGEDGGAGGGQLDRQRHAIESTDDFDEHRQLVVRHLEVGSTLRRPLEEQSNRLAGQHRVCRDFSRLGNVERRNLKHVLSGQSEPLPARRQHTDSRSRGENVVDAVRAFVEDLLAVVEDEQRSPIPQRPLDGLERRLVVGDPHADRLGDTPRHQLAIRNGTQIDEPHPVLMLIDLAGGHLERNPRLPRPARPGQSHEAGLAQQLGDGPHRRFPSDERVHRRRQVVASSRENPQRRE